MAVSVAVPVGESTADALIEKLVPKVEALKIGPYTAGDDVDFGPLVTREALTRVKGLVDQGVKEGADLVVDGRGFSMQGYEDGFFMGGCLFDKVTRDMEIYKTEIFGPVLSVIRAETYEEALDLPLSHEYWQWNGHFHPGRRYGARLRLAHQYRHGRHQRADPGTACLSHFRGLETVRIWRFESARSRTGSNSIPAPRP